VVDPLAFSLVRFASVRDLEILCLVERERRCSRLPDPALYQTRERLGDDRLANLFIGSEPEQFAGRIVEEHLNPAGVREDQGCRKIVRQDGATGGITLALRIAAAFK